MYMCLHSCMYMCLHMCMGLIAQCMGRPEVTVRCLPQATSILVLGKDFSQTWRLPFWLHWLTSKVLGFICVCLTFVLGLEAWAATPAFLHGSWGLDSDLYAGTLRHSLSHWWYFFYIVCGTSWLSYAPKQFFHYVYRVINVSCYGLSTLSEVWEIF